MFYKTCKCYSFSFAVNMVGTSHFAFWQQVLLATRILWIHSEMDTVLFPYVDQIIDFMRDDMSLNLRVVSWVKPMIYVMNDLADPKEDIGKLLKFIDSHMIEWNDHPFIKAYAEKIEELLTDYENM